MDSIQGDVRFSQLVLGVQGIPDVANCAVALDESIQTLNDKRNPCSRIKILSGLDAQIEQVLHLFQPLRGSGQG